MKKLIVYRGRTLMAAGSALVLLAILVVQTGEFGATWDEFLYYKGVRGVVNHGIEILRGNTPDPNAIFGDLRYFGNVSRFIPYALASFLSSLEIGSLESLTDAQKFLMGSFTSLNHISAAIFGWLTACLLALVARGSGKRMLGLLVLLLMFLIPEWSGSALFNNSDVPLGFIFTCFSLSWAVQGWLIMKSDSTECKQRWWMWAAVAGVWGGLSASCRPGAIVFVICYYVVLGAIAGLCRSKRLNRAAFSVALSTTSGLLVYFLTYPQSWGSVPWESLYDAVTYISERQNRGIQIATWNIFSELYRSLPLVVVIGLIAILIRTLVSIKGRVELRKNDFRDVINSGFSWVVFGMALQVLIPLLL